jgi:quinolinate synthase
MIYETPLAVSRTNIESDMRRITSRWTDGSKHFIAHKNTPFEIRREAKFNGSDEDLREWVRQFPHKVGAIFVASDDNIVYDMDEIRPDLVFYHVVTRDEI